MSTSLSDLPMPGGQQMQMQMPNEMSGQQNFDLNKMIDEAANQVNSGNFQQGEEPNLSAGALQYQLDKSQIPLNGPNPNIQMQDQYQPSMTMEQPQYMYEMEPEFEPEKSFVDKLTSDIKIPLLVAVLFVILSLPQFNRMLTKFVPRLLAETGELNMMGLIAKGLILAFLIFGAKYFI
jgi:hypothetical protein